MRRLRLVAAGVLAAGIASMAALAATADPIPTGTPPVLTEKPVPQPPVADPSGQTQQPATTVASEKPQPSNKPTQKSLPKTGGSGMQHNDFNCVLGAIFVASGGFLIVRRIRIH